MIRTNRWFINTDDGSTVPWTSEIESNYKYKEITFRIAKAIDDGVITWQDVVAQITDQIAPESLDEMLEKKAKMNVRSADLKMVEAARADGTEQSGEAKPFEVALPGEGKPYRKSASKTSAKAAAAKAAAALDDLEDDAPKPGAETKPAEQPKPAVNL